MNNGLENKLAEQKLRMAPAEWRTEILREARLAAAQQPEAVSGWRSWLWPAPRAWAVLAACWVLLLAADAVNHPDVPVSAVRTDAGALATALAEKRRALQEMGIAVVTHHVPSTARHLPSGVSGWIREEKGVLAC